MVESTAKLRSEIMALSGVDIMKNANEFKSTYQIMDELAAKWENLTDIQQASITELVAGKRQGNIVSSLMNNFDTARNALETSLNSSGSAMREHEKWQQSLESRILSLKSSWQGLSQAFLSSDFLKVALNGIIGLADGATKLIDTFGTLPTLITTIATGMSIFKNKGFFSVLNKDVAGAQKQFALLGKSFKDISRDMASGQGLFTSLFKKSITKADVGYITDFMNQIKSGVPTGKAWANTMTNASVAGKKMAVGVKQGTVELGSLKTATLGGKAALFGLEAAATAANIALTMGLSFAIQLVVEGVMKLVNAKKDLADSVEELTSKFKEQSSELEKLKGDYDTTNESSMISKYEKLSKGVDGLGHNVSLTADEYSEYQSIVNTIAEQIPSLVSGYDSQGNAILSCKSNVEELTAAYEKLVHAQNQEILTNTGDIEKDFANTLEKSSGEHWWSNGHGFWKGLVTSSFGGENSLSRFFDYELKTDTAKALEELLDGSNKNKDKIYKRLESDAYSVSEIRTLLEKANVDIGYFDNPLDVLEETLETDPQKIKNAVDNYYTQFVEAVEEQKTIAQAKLSEAFDVGSAISGLNYGNISEELQAIAYQTVNSLDFDFFSKLSENGKTVEQWTTEMLNQLNAIDKADNAKLEAAFDLQTQFNGGDISYGEYVGNLKNLESTIDGLDLKDEVKEQLKLSLNTEDILADYNALVNDLKKIGFNDITIENFLNSLSTEEYAAAMEIIPELDASATIADIQAMIDKEVAINGLTVDITVEGAIANLESLSTALSESVSGSGLTTESITAIEGMFDGLSSYDPSKLFERTATGMRLNTTELSKLNDEFKNTNVDGLENKMDALGERYIQTREELSNLTYGTDEYNQKAGELSTIEEQINATEKLIAQYDGLTNAYQEWQRAESSGNQRDMYENVLSGFETVKDELSRGWADDGTVEFLELLTGKTNLAAKSGKELKEIWNGLDDTIKHTTYSVKDFFTTDEDGNSTSKGVYNFLDAIGQMEEEKFDRKDVVKRKDGKIIGFDFQIVGGNEAIAEALGISEELVDIMVRAADDAGFVVSMDGTYQQLDVLKEKAQEAANELKNTFKLTDYEFNLDTTKATGEGSIAEQYEKASSIWEQFKKNKNKDGTVNMDVKGAEEAYTLISTLQTMVDQLSEPVYMELDVSQVEKDMQTPLSKLQEYETLVQSEHQLQLKGTDTSEIDKTQKEIIDYFENLDDETKIKIGIDGLSREEIESKIEKGEIEIPASVDIQMDMSDDIKDMKLLMMNELGLIKDEEVKLKVGYEIDDSLVDTLNDDEKEVVINFISKNEKWFNSLSEEEKEVTIKLIAENKEWYDKLDKDTKEIIVELVSRGVDIETLTNDETKNIIVDFATKNEDLFDKLDDKETKVFVEYIEKNKDVWKNLPEDDKEIIVELIASGVDLETLTNTEKKEVVVDFVTKNEKQFEKLEDEEKQVVVDLVTDDKALKALEEHGVEIEAFCNIFGVEKVDDLKERLNGLDDEQILVVAEVLGKIKVDDLKNAMDGLEDEDVKAIANAIGKGDVDALRTAVFNLEDKEIEALAKALGYEDVNGLKGAMDNLTDKDVQAIAKTLGIKDVDSLRNAINRLTNKDVKAAAKVSGKSDVDGLKSSINNLQGKTVTVWAQIKQKASSLWSKLTGGGGVDGTAHVNGTAFANGTIKKSGRAFKQGDWGTKDSGVALGGEEAPELLVRNGRWHLIGEKGAEFFGYRKGDIIFNASQTREIFEKGKITHGNGRGKALVSGTAFSKGTGGGFWEEETTTTTTTKKKSSGSSSGSSKSSSSSGKKSSSKSSSSSSSKSSSSSSSKASEEAEKFEETIDWIETKIARIERAIDQLDTKASSVYRSWSERNTALANQISEVGNEIDIQQKAYDRYMQEANSIGLSETYASKVRNGTIDIETITDESLKEKIDDYQNWYEKALDCQDAILDLKETEAELYAQRVENVATQYEGILGVIEHEKNMIEEYISQSEANAQLISGEYYKALISNENETVSKLQEQKNKMLSELQVGMNSGTITKGSEAW